MKKSRSKVRTNLEQLDKVSSQAGHYQTDSPQEPKAKQERQGHDYPWEASGVSPEIIKKILLNMPQPLKLQLTWLKQERVIVSEHAFILNLVASEIKKLIKKTTNEKT
ncbi:MAG: hypothetical protein JKY93_00385 [Gammaproteobacteria bacterium]|nr:hypothetical protein [Gammaproteobacteria bacterium]